VFLEEEVTSLNVISFRRIRAFTSTHPEARLSLKAWFTTVKKSRWHNLAEVKQVYPTADLVARYTVFNVKGNKYRLVTRIVYRTQTVFIVAIMTHAEYDLGKWKE
jgi:mRNA interferase HigB